MSKVIDLDKKRLDEAQKNTIDLQKFIDEHIFDRVANAYQAGYKDGLKNGREGK